MNIGNIKNHRMGVLEQACERYAVMAFETMNGRLAIGLRSITQSYNEHDHLPGRGTFTATFVPWDVRDCLKQANRIVEVGFDIMPQFNEQWKLFKGSVTVQGVPKWYDIGWSADGASMKFLGERDDIYSPGADQNQGYPRCVVI